jgi:hypothetical protein
VEAAQAFNPTLVNSHSLKDYFTEDMATEFFAQALAWQAEKGYRYKACDTVPLRQRPIVSANHTVS